MILINECREGKRIKVHKSEFSGLWLVFFGAVFWSLNAPLIKVTELNPILVCGLRSAIAGIVLAPFIRPKQLKWNMWMLLYIFSFTGLSIAIIFALKLTSAIIATGMQATSPIWIFIFGLLGKKEFRWQSLIPIALIFTGVLFFIFGGKNSGNNTVGNFIALSEGLFCALMCISVKKFGSKNPLGATAIANLATAIIVFYTFSLSPKDLISIPTRQWYIMLVLGIFQTGAGYALYNIGVSNVSPQKAAIIALWEMILGPLWVAIFLHEYPSINALLGLVVILLGIILNTFISANERSIKLKEELRADNYA